MLSEATRLLSASHLDEGCVKEAFGLKQRTELTISHWDDFNRLPALCDMIHL